MEKDIVKEEEATEEPVVEKEEEATEEPVIEETTGNDIITTKLDKLLDSIKLLMQQFDEFKEKEPAISVENGETIRDDEPAEILEDNITTDLNDLDLRI